MQPLTTTVPMPKEPAFRRAWLVYQLRLRGWSLRQVASREGVSYEALARTMYAPNSHLEPIIARLLDTTVEELFPERFDKATGRRLHRTRQRSRAGASGNIKAGGAA
jgi:lambda repressor-like predicted transcriptional regulator